jgi:type VI secretion system protein ImpC
MPSSFSFGKLQFDVSLGNMAARAPRDPEAPFLLLVLGDFSGRANRGVNDPAALRRPLKVDCDNFDQIMARVGGALRLPSGGRGPGATLDLAFESMEDFHPDQILKKAAPVTALLDARKRLQEPGTSPAVIAEVQSLLAKPTLPAGAPASSSGESAQETLARLMGGTAPSAPAAAATTGVDISALIRNIAAPSMVASATPEQAAALAAVDLELARELRAILHHPEFQNLEATWRGLDLLVREFGGEENLKLHILDVSQEELAADVQGQENLQKTALFQSLREQGWAALVGAYTFDDCVRDLELAGRLTKIAAALGAPFLAAADPHLAGCDSLVQTPDPDRWTRSISAEVREGWMALRQLPEANHLGLALPRVLMRQPYGKANDPIEAFPFEELGMHPAHDSYLWGNPAFVCGFLLADAFRAEGWELTASGAGELDDLPVHKFTHDGEVTVKPGAEVWLSERAGDRILAQGLMPLLSIKGRGAVRLANLQSVAHPPKPLFLRRA